MPESVKSSKSEDFIGLSPFIVLFGEQPAGTADPPPGILEETRDYYKSECCTTHTRIEDSTKLSLSFH